MKKVAIEQFDNLMFLLVFLMIVIMNACKS